MVSQVLGPTSDYPEREPVDSAYIDKLVTAVRNLGMDCDEDEAELHSAIWGRLSGTKVALGVRFVGGRPAGYAHFAEAEAPLLGPVTIEPWTGQAQLRQICGDAATDDALAVHGEPSVVCALLDPATRKRLVELFATEPGPASLRIQGCRLTLRGPDTMDLSHRRIMSDVLALVELAGASGVGARALLDRVVHNALEDPVPEVRERNAEMLGQIMSSADEESRTRAAQRLLLSDQVSLDHRLDIFRMVRGLPESRVLPLMQSLLEEGSQELVRRAVTWAEEVKSAGSVRQLLRVLRRFEDPAIIWGVASALCVIEDPKSQPTLLHLLEREDEGLRQLVIEGLGRFGSTDAVSQILPFTKGLFADRELKRCAKRALEQIKARASLQD